MVKTDRRVAGDSSIGEVLVVSPSPAASPSQDSHQQLYKRLVDYDPIAPDDIATTFLEPLINWLSSLNQSIHPDLVNEAAEDALLALIHNPSSYDPSKSTLETYLRMSAQGDLRNILSRESAHRSRHKPLKAVELSDKDGKYMGREEDPSLSLLIHEKLASLAEDVPATIRESLTEVEARVLELMLRRERRTVVYAEACGIADRPIHEQRRLVKRIKDRLLKRIERQRGS
jgi:hypothetical protein